MELVGSYSAVLELSAGTREHLTFADPGILESAQRKFQPCGNENEVCKLDPKGVIFWAKSRESVEDIKERRNGIDNAWQSEEPDCLESRSEESLI